MSKFKVGDRVIRHQSSNHKAVDGGMYEVAALHAGSRGILLVGHGPYKYAEDFFEMAPSYFQGNDVDPELKAYEAAKTGDVVAVPVGAKATQIGGSHYKDLAIQPVEYIHANGIAFMEGNVIKYVSRWRKKGGVDDLRKAKHHLELLIELEEAKA